VTAPDPKLFDTHDAKGRRKVFATPKNCFAGFTQWPDAYCGNGVAGCSNRTRVSLFLTGFWTWAGGHVVSQNAPNRL